MSSGLTLALALLLIVVPAGLSQAQETISVTGVFEYESPPPGIIVESIAVNTVTMEFPPAGGPFTGTARLELIHDVPDRGCQFQSTHVWEFSGEFDPATGQFSGTWVEVEDATSGACESFSFVRDFNPQEDEFSAVLIAQFGEIRGRVATARFTLQVDPALFETPAPRVGGEPSDLTTDPGQTSQTQPPTTGTTTVPDDTGFPWLLWLIILLFAAAAYAAGQRLFRRGGDEESQEKEEDCSELERLWRQAQDLCDKARQRSSELSDRFDEAAKRLDEIDTERAALPSEETRVELPDGTSLSQLDLELRRAAAGAAWDSYMADPSPESAAAAEKAWQQQATPEWLEEQRRAHQAEKDRLDGELDGARAKKDSLGKELAESRAKEKDACAKAAELRRKLDECLKQAAAAKAAEVPAPLPAEPERTPPSGTGPAPPLPSPPPGAPQPAGSEESEPEGCRDGDERWREFDGPHPFTIPTDEVVNVTVVLISGTRRGTRIGSLDRADFVNLDDRGQTAGIPFHVFGSLSPADIRGAFSGTGGLAELWETAGSGAVQRLNLTLSYGKRTVLATCERKEICVDGQWQPQARWRPRVSGDPEMVSDSITVQGNVEAGVGVAEESYLDALVAFFQKTQSNVRTLMSAKEAYDKYQRDCKAGRR